MCKLIDFLKGERTQGVKYKLIRASLAPSLLTIAAKAIAVKHKAEGSCGRLLLLMPITVAQRNKISSSLMR